ncbi:hypothetical protein GF352_04625 [archaeon]|nr:hypothetical protein [archaeon]
MELKELIKNPGELRELIKQGIVDPADVRREVCDIKRHEPLDELINGLIKDLNPVPCFDYDGDEVIKSLEADAAGTDKHYKAMIHNEVLSYTKKRDKGVKQAVNTNLIWYILAERLGHFCLKKAPTDFLGKIAAYSVYLTSRRVGAGVTWDDLGDRINLKTSTLRDYSKTVMKKLLGAKFHLFWDRSFLFKQDYKKLLDDLDVPYSKIGSLLSVDCSELTVKQLNKINGLEHSISSYSDARGYGYQGFLKSRYYDKLMNQLTTNNFFEKEPC